MNNPEENGALALCIDNDHVTITIERLQELLKAEIKLDVLKQAYYTAKYSSDTEEMAKILFGPKPVQKDDEDD